MPTTSDHWIDTLYGKVRAHIEDFRHQRDELVNRTMPPAVLFDHAFSTDERSHIQYGIALNKLYSTTRGKILHNKRPGERLTEADMNVIRSQVDHFLSRFDPSEQSAVIRGALVATYMSDSPSDSVLWMLGEKTERGTLPGMAQKTMQALREIGVLDEVRTTAGGGVLRYPRATISEPMLGRSIGIQGVWFNWYCAQQRAKGLPIPEQMSDVPKAEMKAAKAHVAQLAQLRFKDMTVTIRSTTYTSKKGEVVERLGAYTESGNLLGLLTLDGEKQLADLRQVTLRFALAVDGNVRLLWDDPS